MNRQSLVLSDEQRDELLSNIPAVSSNFTSFKFPRVLTVSAHTPAAMDVWDVRWGSASRCRFHVRVSRGTCVRGAAPMIRLGVRPASRIRRFRSFRTGSLLVIPLGAIEDIS